MMLCKADFEEIFPELFKPNQFHLAEKPVGVTRPACIARWEDDGGRLCKQLHRHDAPVARTASDGYAIPDPMRTSFALATMPVAAAYGAAWTMISGFDRMTRF